MTAWIRRLLARLLPEGTGRAALADLERELAELRATRGPRNHDPLWFLVEGLRVAARLRVGRLLDRSGRGAGRTPRGRRQGPVAGVLAEVGVAARGLLRSPLLLLSASAVLALGVAAPTLMYSLVRGIGAELPVPGRDELVHLGFTNARFAPFVQALPQATVAELLREPPAAGPVAAYAPAFTDLSGGEHPERLLSGWVTPDFLKVLGVQPAVGRDFVSADAEPGAPAVILVSERLWRERFGADPDLIGSTLRVDGEPATVVGVVATPLRLPGGADVWIPWGPGVPGVPEGRLFEGIARIPEGPAREAALDELRARTGATLGLAGDRVGEDPRPVVRPYREEMLDREARTILAAMLSLAGLVLLVACANVANLLLSRAIGRRREVAVRVALGASRARVAVHQFGEAATVGLLGGAVGCGLAMAGMDLAKRALADELAWWMEIRLDPGVMAFAVAVVSGAAILSGLVPALHASRSAPDRELRGGARTGEGPHLSRISRGLVVIEVAFSAAVLVVGGLMLRGALETSSEDASRAPESVLAAAYTMPVDRPGDGAGRLAFHRALVEDLSLRAGVEAAALAGFLPGVFSVRRPVGVEGLPDSGADLTTHVVPVSPGFFDALGVRLVRGRDLDWRDGGEEPPAVVVNEAFVRRYLGGGDALGRRVTLLPPAVEDTVVATIVGVAPPLGVVDPGEGWGDAVYVPPAVSPTRGAFIVLRARAGHGALALLPEARRALAALDPDRPLYEPATLAEHQRSRRMTPWFFTGLFTTFGLAALLMATAGLYVVIAFSVGRRRREVGVRVALGAGPGRVVWTVGRGAAFQLGLGVTLGLGLALAAAPVLGEALQGADPRDPVIYVLTALVVIATGLAASGVPAARALRVPPAEALRVE